MKLYTDQTNKQMKEMGAEDLIEIPLPEAEDQESVRGQARFWHGTDPFLGPAIEETRRENKGKGLKNMPDLREFDGVFCSDDFGMAAGYPTGCYENYCKEMDRRVFSRYRPHVIVGEEQLPEPVVTHHIHDKSVRSSDESRPPVGCTADAEGPHLIDPNPRWLGHCTSMTFVSGRRPAH